MSIRARLLVWLLCGVSGAVALGAWSTYLAAREEANALFDYQLQQTALSLRDHAFANGVLAPEVEPDGLDTMIQIWSVQGGQIYFSHPRSRMPVQAPLGYANVRTQDGQWRVFAMRLGDHVIQVGQPQAVRNRLAAAVALRTLWPFLLLLPLLGVLIWLTVGRGLRPLEELAREVRGRTPESLRPLPEHALPEELTPLSHALNGLLQQLSQALETQRAFIADAAHELRTPLTALALQAQLAERADSEIDRKRALGELRAGVERATRLVGQLLTLARNEAPAAPDTREAVNLEVLLREVIGDYSALAERRHIDLGITRSEALEVQGEPMGLRTLVSNLIDNALKYTPEHGRVDASLSRSGQDALIEIQDTGPGIPEADHERVFGRFYRRPGVAREISGSGLGLAIVRRIAVRHGGSARLDRSPSGGLRVTILLPRTGLPADDREESRPLRNS